MGCGGDCLRCEQLPVMSALEAIQTVRQGRILFRMGGGAPIGSQVSQTSPYSRSITSRKAGLHLLTVASLGCFDLEHNNTSVVLNTNTPTYRLESEAKRRLKISCKLVPQNGAHQTTRGS
ncbi:hypothetical protein ILYODFUR_030222 [Ilyodon furcidens]|uniref:Uncharacterized protein n=1 Tax=Ilyodon furcidens TaxID=33524 RepID=A0ABV0T2W8_9TELE